MIEPNNHFTVWDLREPLPLLLSPQRSPNFERFLQSMNIPVMVGTYEKYSRCLVYYAQIGQYNTVHHIGDVVQFVMGERTWKEPLHHPKSSNVFAQFQGVDHLTIDKIMLFTEKFKQDSLMKHILTWRLENGI